MKKTAITLLLAGAGLTLMGCMQGKKSAQIDVGLSEAIGDRFTMGAALNLDQIYGRDTLSEEVLRKHFNSIVAENCMKSMYMQPQEGTFFFDDADRFIAYGQAGKYEIIGHTLIWHSQSPDWFFTDKNGKEVSKDVLIERMRKHIHTIVGRYKGQVKGWDVVNEAVLDNGELRDSKFLKIIGAKYISLAFKFAAEADPNAELYYNDYSMSVPAKREGVVRLVNTLKSQGIRIDGIGMQGHVGMNYPKLGEFEKSIETFYGLGLPVMITEFDITVLPSPEKQVSAEVSLNYAYDKELNPYVDGIPDSIAARIDQRFEDFFNLFIKHSDKLTRVTTWGISDANSWRNDWPVKGRTDFPLLFDRKYSPKPLVHKIIHTADSLNKLEEK